MQIFLLYGSSASFRATASPLPGFWTIKFFYTVMMLAPRPIPNLVVHGASYNPPLVSHTLPSKRSHVLSPSLMAFVASKPRLYWKQCDLQSFLRNFTAFKKVPSVWLCVCVGVLVICALVFTVFLYCFVYVYLFFLCFCLIL